MARRKNPYSVHPGVEMSRKWEAELPEKTGRSMEQWIALVRREGPSGEKERRAWLQKTHGLDRSHAWWLAERSLGKGTWVGDPEEYLVQAVRSVDEQYAGPKAALRPVYDRLLAIGLSLGKDVRVCPCQTMVPFYRKYVFAEVHATTNTRVDLDLALGDEKPRGRLTLRGGRSDDRVRHRIGIASVEEIDGEVEGWLRRAYEGGDATQKKRTPETLPAELKRALAGNAKARATFESLAPGHRGEWIRFIADAKKAETRGKRVARAMERLAAGKKTTY